VRDQWDQNRHPALNSFDCTFLDGPANSTVQVTANDGDPSNNVGSASVVVTIANVAPTVLFTTGPASANEGDTKTYTYTVADPGADPNPTIIESCGANGTRIDTPAANSFDCTFPDGPAMSIVLVTANDGDASNNIGSASIDVAIANVAPSVSLSGHRMRTKATRRRIPIRSLIPAMTRIRRSSNRAGRMGQEPTPPH
jgi:hypothetical protein